MAQEFPGEIYRKFFSFFDDQRAAARMLMANREHNKARLFTLLAVPAEEIWL